MKRTYTVEDAFPVTIAYPKAKELEQEHHFKNNINLAWAKLNEYYTHTDDSPVYLAATVLHPIGLRYCDIGQTALTGFKQVRKRSLSSGNTTATYRAYLTTTNCPNRPP